MSKRKPIEPDDDAVAPAENRAMLYPVTLTMREWRDRFDEEQRQIIIAEALNYCTYNHGLNISGYLINKLRLHLVLKVRKADINGMLQLFYDQVEREIKRHRAIDQFGDGDQAENTGKQPFIRHDMINNYLQQLITGRQVEIGYYDPRLERLKNMVNRSTFCSVIDYSGAIGPVVVKLLNDSLISG